MRWFVFALVVCLCGSRTSKAQEQLTVLPDAPRPQPAIIVGTVTDVNDDTVPGATAVLEGPAPKVPRTVVTNDRGFFEFNDVEPGATYHVTISAPGFANWISPAVILKPGQYAILTGTKLYIAEALTTITVNSPAASPEEIAAEQVKAEEHQRVFGIIPNFYVAYDQSAAPLTTKLKFKLAAKVAFDPVTFIGVGLIAAMALAIPAALPTSCSEAPSCHRFCTRTRATSTRARARRDLALSTRSRSHSSVGATTDGGSRTTRPSVAIWAQPLSRWPTTRRRIAARAGCSRLLLSTPASAHSPTWHRSSSCGGSRPKPKIKNSGGLAHPRPFDLAG